jgi:hypothetical protein
MTVEFLRDERGRLVHRGPVRLHQIQRATGDTPGTLALLCPYGHLADSCETGSVTASAWLADASFGTPRVVDCGGTLPVEVRRTLPSHLREMPGFDLRNVATVTPSAVADTILVDRCHLCRAVRPQVIATAYLHGPIRIGGGAMAQGEFSTLCCLAVVGYWGVTQPEAE